MCDGDGIAVELAVFVDGAVGLVLVVGLVDVVVELDDVGLVEGDVDGDVLVDVVVELDDVVVELDDVGLVEVDVDGDVLVDVVVEVEGAEAVTVMESTTFVPLL